MIKYPLTNKAAAYARQVVACKIPACLQVQQACQRHLDDLNQEKKASYPYKFDKYKSESILKFAEMLPHVKGKWAGQKIVLEPHQCFELGVPFGWVRKKDNLRRFREIFILKPRKNGKSVEGAIIGNYMVSADNEPGAEVYSAATSKAQAYEVFRPAWLMSQKEPGYRRRFGLELGGTTKNPGNIYSVKNGSRFETVVGTPGDGASAHAWLLDEFHEAKHENSYDTGKTGMGARTQPMMVVISTAGTNTAYPCYALQQRVEKVLSGDLIDNELFGIVYTIDKDDDWTDFNVWKKANPNFGVSLSEEFLRSQYRVAMQDPRKQNIIKCKHLNVWSNAGTAWMNMAEWNRCASQLDIKDFIGAPVYLGLDLASKIDIAAKIYLFKRDDDYFMFSKYYLPEEMTFTEEHAHYAGWAYENYIELTPGSRIDIESIQESIKQDAIDYDLSGSENYGGEVCSDPWNAQQLITNLLAEGIECVEVNQTVNKLSEPMKEIEAAVKSGNFYHDGNPVTDWMISNICVKVDTKDNIFPFKEGNENKIDGGVALITAMSRAMYEEGIMSVYETRGVIAL